MLGSARAPVKFEDSSGALAGLHSWRTDGVDIGDRRHE